MPAAKPADKPNVNLSSVGAGTVVIHKAFGEGTVKKIEKSPMGDTHIFVVFGRNEKMFGFPGAFYDGFLKVKE